MSFHVPCVQLELRIRPPDIFCRKNDVPGLICRARRTYPDASSTSFEVFMKLRPPSQEKSVLLLGVAASLMISKAGAFEERLVWDAPAACPGAAQVLSVVSELTGEQPPDLSTFQTIEGVVERHGAAWQLSLTLLDGARRRSRVITAPRCEDLVRAAGVAIALALDGSIEATVQPPDPSSEVSREEPMASVPEVLPTVVEPVKLEPVAASELHGLIEAEALVDVAALRAAAPGAGVAVGLKRRALTGLAHAVFLPTRREALGATASLELTLIAGGLRACYELARGLLDASVCGGAELGRLTARGRGLANARAYTDWWLAPSVGLALGSTLGSTWYFRLYGDALLPILRERYRVNESILVHRPPSVGFRAGLAIGVELDGEDG